MASSGLMSIGMRAMFANYSEMQTTGHNIANASVAGYSRQSVVLATSQGQYTGNGYFGKGVDVVTVQRASNRFLTAQAQAATAMSKMDDTRQTQLAQLENVFPTGDTGMGSSMSNFLNAFVDLANTPADSSARQVVLARASEVAARFATAGSNIDMLQSGVNDDLKNSVAEVNTLAGQVASLNGQIAAARGLGQPPNDLMDKRDELVKEISGYVKVSTIEADDGTTGVFVAGGQRLVLGSSATALQVVPDAADSSRSALAMDDGKGLRPISTDLLVGGSISGLIRFQNEDLVDARNKLGQMAASFSYEVNDTQHHGLDLGQPAVAGVDMFKVTDPQAVANRNNARAAGGNYDATVTMTTVDGTQLQASDYDMKADPAVAGGYTITRLADGVDFSAAPDGSGGFTFQRLGKPSVDASTGALSYAGAPMALGSSMDGFSLKLSTLSGGAPAVTDRFLLQPVGRAASGMSRVLDDPNGIAAAAPQTAVMAATNTGTASVARLNVTDNTNVPSKAVRIDFTGTTTVGGVTTMQWTATDLGTNTAISSGNWGSGTAIHVNGQDLMLNGVPAVGDQVTLSATAHPESNNGNALGFAALRDAKMVGQQVQSGGALAGGATVTDAYASAIADIGVRVQAAKTSASISAAGTQQADQAVSARMGVNIDEEAANLIQYQQGYQAAAKVLQVAQSIFNTMLQVAGG